MSNISGVNRPVVSSSPSLEMGAKLDGDTLLLYCSGQLNQLNGDIKAQMQLQQDARTQKQLLNKLRDLLAAKAKDGIATGDQANNRAILSAYADVLSKMPPGEMKNNLMASFDRFRDTGCFSNNHAATGTKVPSVALNNEADRRAYVDGGQLKHEIELPDYEQDASKPRYNDQVASEISDRLKEVDGVGEEIGKDADLQMTNLSQLVSQRQMALQMTTNLMTKFNQGEEAIANNVGK